MIYEVNEIFQSIQGEGLHTGMPANFIRLAGCNLNCKFCDTNKEVVSRMSADRILCLLNPGIKTVVLTGGEPFVQPLEDLTKALSNQGYTICVETNGTFEQSYALKFIHWITVSPKKDTDLNRRTLRYTDEVKFLWDPEQGYGEAYIEEIMEKYCLYHCNLWVQPIWCSPELGSIKENLTGAYRFCMQNPQFKLSIQTHKYIGVR